MVSENFVVVKVGSDLNLNEIVQFFVMCNIVIDLVVKYFEGGVLVISVYQQICIGLLINGVFKSFF